MRRAEAAIPTEFPQSHAALYDQLHERFGFGSYDDVATPQPPWYRARITEVNKLRAQMRKRRLTERQVAIAAWWAVRCGVVVRWPSDLFKVVPDAMVAYRSAIEAQKKAERVEVLDRAINLAWAQGREVLAQELYRVRFNPAEIQAALDRHRDSLREMGLHE